MAVIAAAIWFLAHNTLENMRVRGIQSGFGFLAQPAGFDIGESAFAFDSGDAYWKAFLVGLSNTLRAALVGIVLTTILGTLIGIGRLSRNFLVRGLCTGYVELFRNIPVLIQLLMWYIVLNGDWLPPAAEALHPLPGIFLSKSGMSFPVPEWEQGHLVTLAGFAIGVAVAWLYRRWARAAFEKTGVARPMVWPALLIACAGALLGWLAGGAPTALEMPVRNDLNVSGGGAVTPEFLAVTTRAHDLHRVLRRGNRALRHPVGAVGTDGGGGSARAVARAGAEARAAAAGAARDHSAADQPVPEPHQELVAWRSRSATRTWSRFPTRRSTRPAVPSSASRSSWPCISHCPLSPPR